MIVQIWAITLVLIEIRNMALPSRLFSFASRVFSLRQAKVTRWIHSSPRSTAQVDISQTPTDEQSPDFLEAESTLIPDIEVDDTLKVKDFFDVRSLCSTPILFHHKVHYGHKASSLDPGMKQFVYGVRANHVIFDLDITNYHLREALNVAAHIALRDGIILFVARLPHCNNMIEQTAKDCGEFAHTRKWEMSTLLDIKKLQRMECRLPDLLIFPSTVSEFGKEHDAVREAAKLNIPTIGVVDSNCSPSLITYPIPGNDDSYSAIQLYCSLFKEAITRGKKERAHRLDLMQKEIELEKKQRLANTKPLS